ncbi:MAG TPA: xanthine dehydrogenase family protein subunit M [candidate division Zixibacteria bacterium]|nr:xanthine dehydrogenase family protein subunit M [candidate division Zixibacteria bacterium]
MEYFEPRTIGDALAVLARYGERARVIAGGTDVMVDMKYKEEPECLVNIKRISGLREIRENGGSVSVGPLATIRQLEANPSVRARLPVLWDACRQFASLQIRNTATIGGNVCRASPSGETLAPLLVLEALGTLAFPEGERREPLRGFFHGPGRTSLGGSGLLTKIEIPYPKDGSAGVYLKHAVRGPMDIAVVGVAVLLVPDEAGDTVAEARIGLGAVAPTPIRASGAEEALRGRPLTAALAAEAAGMAAAEASPISDQRASAEYRRWIVETLVRRGLEQAWRKATGKEVAR